MSKPVKVLMVCLGNICRSPTAEGIFQGLIEQNHLSDWLSVDSAGTSGWHIGEPPDSRSQAAARRRGLELSHQRGRQVKATDFDEFDYILAMDKDNLYNLRQLAPAGFKGTLGLLLEYGTQVEYDEVPDPYHGGGSGFELVLDLVQDACEGLLEHIQNNR